VIGPLCLVNYTFQGKGRERERRRKKGEGGEKKRETKKRGAVPGHDGVRADTVCPISLSREKKNRKKKREKKGRDKPMVSYAKLSRPLPRIKGRKNGNERNVREKENEVKKSGPKSLSCPIYHLSKGRKTEERGKKKKKKEKERKNPILIQPPRIKKAKGWKRRSVYTSFHIFFPLPRERKRRRRNKKKKKRQDPSYLMPIFFYRNKK